ncbi:hypothetical protein [Mycetohabitans sp. B46]|uniref:hypothetical protein n=1 Tax=Mycetohabitans sp. B46 TaxID=2772536 RepID=UPI0030A303CC
MRWIDDVTPSAVSHGIVGLDKALGVELFTREPRALVLMVAGTDYLSYSLEAVFLIALGTQRLAHSRGSRAIAISGAPTLASRWLRLGLPRLRQLRWAAIAVAGFVAAMLYFPIDDAAADVTASGGGRSTCVAAAPRHAAAVWRTSYGDYW